MRSRQLLFFAGRDEGAGDLIVLEEDTGYCFQTRFKYAMEMTFRYSVYHLILHWNHYLCSGALSH
jgi:hypothetical protein